MYHACPYGMWPKRMIIHGAEDIEKFLNAFPPKGGLSNSYSPRAIILGKALNYNHHCTIPFGQYVQAHTQNNPTNTIHERTIDSIYLGALDNIQGGHKVLNLRTGQKITHHRVTPVPVTDDVIRRVEALAKQDGMKVIQAPMVRLYRMEALSAGVDNAIDDAEDDDQDNDVPDLIPADDSSLHLDNNVVADFDKNEDDPDIEDMPPPLIQCT